MALPPQTPQPADHFSLSQACRDVQARLGLNKYNWHFPLLRSEWFSLLAITVLYFQAVGLYMVTGKWWVGVLFAMGVTHLTLFVLARDHNGDMAHLWVLCVGTKIQVPWQINGPREIYESEWTVNGEPTEQGRETRLFIDENFHPRDYVYTKNREIIFRRKSDAVMFKLACGPFPQAANA